VARVPERPIDGQIRRGARQTTPVRRALVNVEADFTDEYPEADASCTELFASLLVVGDVLMDLHERRIELTLGASQNVAQALAIVDGAGQPLTPSEIAERMLVSSATITSLLDTLERRGWVRRTPNPDDRRSLLIEITTEGRAMSDAFIPGLHKVERQVMSELSSNERRQLMALLGRVLARANDVNGETPEPLAGIRRRPKRLD
jgi:DNA-binding MarR family transcriptional regulator